MRSPFRLARPLFPILLALLSACGGGGSDGGTTNPPPIPQGFTVALSSTTLSVEQGANASVTATIGRTGSFAGTVNLTIEGAPAGLTAAFSTSAITSTTTSTTLTVTASASLAPGAYPLTIRGQATGLSDQTGAVSVTVTAKPAIAMTLAPPALSIPATGSGSYTATIARTNFAGAVAVAVTGAPAGVTPTVTTAGDVYTVALAVGGAVAPGSYTLTTTATGTGVSAVSGEVTLTVTPAPPPSISLTATPAALSIQAGGASVSTTIAITRINFGGTVVIAAQSGLPAGASVSNNPGGPTAASSVVVTFSATAATIPGTYTVVLQGGGFQATAGTVQIALTVTAPNTSGAIALSILPASLSVQPGGIVTGNVTITRTNYTGTVTLAVSGSPTAVTANLSTTSTTGNSSTLTVGAGSSAAQGNYTLTITATGTGIPAVQLTVPLAVAPIASGGNVNLRFCTGFTAIPIWFAVQNGGSSSPWTVVQPGAGNSYSFNISTIGAFAFVSQQAANNYQLTIAYGSAAELSGRAGSYCPAQTLKTVSGTVTGFGVNNADFVSVSMGTAFAVPQPSFALPNFQLAGVSPDARDLIGTRSTFNASNTANPIIINKMFIKRGLNPPNLGSVGTVDFEGADAFAPTTAALTINGLAQNELVSVSNTFITGTQSFGSLGAVPLSTPSTANVFIVPPSRTVAGDVQAFAANAAVISGSLATEIRSVTAAFQDPTNRTVTLGARLNAPTITTAATAPYARLRVQATRQADYPDLWIANFTQIGGSPRSANITMTQGYIGSAGTFDVTIPDFSALSGWQNTWGPITGASTSWNVSMTGYMSGNGGLTDGAIFRIAQRQGVMTP